MQFNSNKILSLGHKFKNVEEEESDFDLQLLLFFTI